MQTLFYIFIGAVSAFVGTSLDRIFAKKIKRHWLSFLLAWVVTLVLVAALSLLAKAFFK